MSEPSAHLGHSNSDPYDTSADHRGDLIGRLETSLERLRTAATAVLERLALGEDVTTDEYESLRRELEHCKHKTHRWTGRHWKGSERMSITTITVEGQLHTNELAPIDSKTEPFEGDDGLAEVEVSDENVVSLHLRHYMDESAFITLKLTRADALALAEVLRAASATVL